MPKKTKSNEKGTPAKDRCQTPPYALDPLLQYLPKDWLIWEPACGEGLLAKGLVVNGYDVYSSDIILGQNFFKYEPDIGWDAIVTNPPFSVKYPWLKRCYELGKPFALLMPVDVFGAQSAQRLFEQ